MIKYGLFLGCKNGSIHNIHIVLKTGGVGSVNAHTPFKNFLESYGSPGHNLHWFSEVGVLEAHLSSKSPKIWGTGCGSIQTFLSLRRS